MLASKTPAAPVTVPWLAPPSHLLIESAKLAGVEPRAYLDEAARRAIRNLGTATLARDLKSSES